MTVDPKIKDTDNKVPEQENKLQSKPEESHQASSQPSTPPEEDANTINWRKFRQKREEERKETEALRARAQQKEEEVAAMKAAMEAIVNKPAPLAQQEDVEESEEERIDRKVKAALAKEKAQEEENRRKREAAELPNTLARTYPDFNSVCSAENLDYLEYHYPEVAAAYKNSPDTFDKWANIYRAVKRFIPNQDSARDKAKIEKNLSKPQSMSQAGVAQTGDHAPSILDDQRKRDNWARMSRALKGL